VARPGWLLWLEVEEMAAGVLAVLLVACSQAAGLGLQGSRHHGRGVSLRLEASREPTSREVLRLPVDPFTNERVVELSGSDLRSIQRLHQLFQAESGVDGLGHLEGGSRSEARGGEEPRRARFARFEQRDTLVVVLASPSDTAVPGAHDPLLAALSYLGFSATLVSLPAEAWAFANLSATSHLDSDSQKLHESLREAVSSLEREPTEAQTLAVSPGRREKVLKALYPLLNELEKQLLEICARYPSTALALVGGSEASWILHAFIESRGNQWRWLRPAWSLVSLDDTPPGISSGLAQDIAAGFPERSSWVRYLHIHSTTVDTASLYSDHEDPEQSDNGIPSRQSDGAVDAGAVIEAGVQTCLVSKDEASAAEVEECFVHHPPVTPSTIGTKVNGNGDSIVVEVETPHLPGATGSTADDHRPESGEKREDNSALTRGDSEVTAGVHDGDNHPSRPLATNVDVPLLMRPALLEHWVTKLDYRLGRRRVKSSSPDGG